MLAGLNPSIVVAAMSAIDLMNVCMELPPLTRGSPRLATLAARVAPGATIGTTLLGVLKEL